MESSEVLARVARVPLVFDALRACDADGVLAPGELEQIKRPAGALGVTEETVDRLREAHRQEEQAHAVPIAAVFPEGTPLLAPACGAAGGGSAAVGGSAFTRGTPAAPPPDGGGWGGAGKVRRSTGDLPVSQLRKAPT
ncbi:hypothetical protein [Kitasatospora cheerisanensis]|nr:hypothetical protein [Kitasatospora cheerisanensis]